MGLLALQGGASLSLNGSLVAEMFNGTSRPYYNAWIEAGVAACAVTGLGACGVLYRGHHRRTIWLISLVWLGLLALPTLFAFDWYVLKGGL
jgi:hypothetical protein